MEWINENKEWLYPLVGFILEEVIVRVFPNKKYKGVGGWLIDKIKLLSDYLNRGK